MSIPDKLVRASQASAIAAAVSADARIMEIGAAVGSAATSSAAGKVMPATQNNSRELGAITQPSSWYGDLLQNLVNHFHDAQSFNLEFGTQDQAMLEHRNRHTLNVVRRDEIAP